MALYRWQSLKPYLFWLQDGSTNASSGVMVDPRVFLATAIVVTTKMRKWQKVMAARALNDIGAVSREQRTSLPR